MFAVLFAFIFVTAYATEELPSYIHACGRKDPNYDQCIANSVKSALNALCTIGMPEFNITAILDPLVFDKIIFYDTNDLKLNIEDVKVTGICNLEINSVDVSSDKLHFELNAALKDVSVNSKYNFAIHLLVSLVNNGLIRAYQEGNASIKFIVDLKEITKNGKTQIYASKVTTFVDIEGFNFEFDESEKDLVELHNAMSAVINENKKDIIMKIKSVMGEKLSKMYISIFDNIVYNRHDQLFPDHN